MDIIVTFFRDVLDGPLYYIVAFICLILICSCIGYMAEVSLNKKKALQKYNDERTSVSSDLSAGIVENQMQSSVIADSNNVSQSTTTDINQNLVGTRPMSSSSNVPSSLVGQDLAIAPGTSTALNTVANTVPSVPQIPSAPTMPQTVPQNMGLQQSIVNTVQNVNNNQ